MKHKIILFLTTVALSVSAELRDGIIPAGCNVLTLTKLPDSSVSSCTVRLSPPGRPLVLFNGRIVSLAEKSDEPLFDWAPLVEDGGSLVDFCWLNSDTPVLLQESRVKIFKNGSCVVNFSLPVKNMSLARAGNNHCYLFGGGQNDVLLLGIDGSVSNLIHSVSPVTAVAGDGLSTFAAAGSTVYFLHATNSLNAVFIAQSAVTDLALVPSNGVFYATEKGVGCLAGPGKAKIFLPQRIVSMDCRDNRLLVLTMEREVVLMDPVAGFPALIESAMKVSEGTSQPVR